MSLTALTLDRLAQALEGRDAALRLTVTLQPAGGVGDKIFPPTYEGGRYAIERRRVGADEVETVLLDSVASQANRMEQALREAWEAGRLEMPNLTVTFPAHPHIGTLTALDVPHRVADAILRDSLLGDKLFRESEAGRSFTLARPNNARALFELCPTALLFGVWDSTGPAGGLGAKFARALVSELVGLDAVPGKKVSSRLDPLQITVNAAVAYEHPTEGWTLDPAQARKDDKKKEPLKKGKDGRPSEINHGNVTPTIEDTGGYTVREARQLAVLSLAGLRRLRFPTGSALTGSGSTAPATSGSGGKGAASASLSAERQAQDRAARLVLATLGLVALRLQLEQGFDLRSRCQLVPARPPVFELVSSGGEAPEAFSVSIEQALSLYAQAVQQARALGFQYRSEPLALTPSPKLLTLVQKSVEQLMKTKEV